MMEDMREGMIMTTTKRNRSSNKRTHSFDQIDILDTPEVNTENGCLREQQSLSTVHVQTLLQATNKDSRDTVFLYNTINVEEAR